MAASSGPPCTFGFQSTRLHEVQHLIIPALAM